MQEAHGSVMQARQTDLQMTPLQPVQDQLVQHHHDLGQPAQDRPAEPAPTMSAQAPPAQPLTAQPTHMRRLWCGSCNAEARDDCLDEGHAGICSLKRMRSQLASPFLQTARVASRQSRQLATALSTLCPEMEATCQWLQERHRQVQRLADRMDQITAFLEHGSTATDEEWEQVMQEVATSKPLLENVAAKLRLLQCRTEPAAKLYVSWQRNGVPRGFDLDLNAEPNSAGSNGQDVFTSSRARTLLLGMLLNTDQKIKLWSTSSPMVQISLASVSEQCVGTGTCEKEELFQPGFSQLRLVSDLNCSKDPEWALRLLEHLSPFLLEIDVINVRQPHLEVLLQMPHLRRLSLRCVDDSHLQHAERNLRRRFPPPTSEAIRIIPLPDTGGHRGLERLNIASGSLSLPVIAEIVTAERFSLQELEICSFVPAEGPSRRIIEDAVSGTEKLRRITFSSSHRDAYDSEGCRVFRRALAAACRRREAGLYVFCTHCAL